MLKLRDIESEIIEYATKLESEQVTEYDKLSDLKKKIDNLEYWVTDYHDYKRWVREYNSLIERS